MTIITTTEELQAFCDRLAEEEFITVDTEFIRDRTYYPQLCLIQLATDNEAVAVDTLAKGIDLTPLAAIFANTNIVKVFHSARQDIEIILGMYGAVPTPLFDTQVAATVCGFGEAASYETLASKLAGAVIDKSSRFTDWSQRPLSEKQYHYAISDVTHLRIVYRKLLEMLEKSDRHAWLGDEIAALTNPEKYQINPEESWKRIKFRSTSPGFIKLVKELAKWRELMAQKINIPRNHLLKEAVLLEIAAAAPTSLADLKRVRNIGSIAGNDKLGEQIVSIIQTTKDLPKEASPSKEPGRSGTSNGALVELLRVLLKMKCEEHQIAEKMIALTEDLYTIACEEGDALTNLPAMQGWRYDIFGKWAMELKEGKIALSARDNQVKIVTLDTAEAIPE